MHRRFRSPRHTVPADVPLVDPGRRRWLQAPVLGAVALGLSGAWSLPAAQVAGGAARDTLVLGMTLEPPGLDPTAGAASAIAEITLYNIYETLTRIGPDGVPRPLLAESWSVTPDQKTWTFRLRRDARFHSGEALSSAQVRFSLERAGAAGSVNKDRATFSQIERIATPDPHTVVLTLRRPNPDLLFQLGQATAVIVDPGTAEGNATRPVGTGPYRLQAWNRGASVVLARWPEHRHAADVALRQVTIRFISDPAAQVAALLSGDVDAFPRVAAARSLRVFQSDPRRFQVLVGGSRAKVILAMNNARPPLNDVRVRRAIAMAIDRQQVIQGAADGFGVPIGSYYTPGAPGYVDLTAVHAHNPDRARALLREAGVRTPLQLTLTLPPPPYARQGGEVIAAQLAQVGIQARLQNVEWAQWLSAVYGQKAYDLTLIAHVEPLDFGNFARPGYYWGYESSEFNALWERVQGAADPAERDRLMGQAQRLVAEDAVAAYLYQPTWITVAHARLQGLWKEQPIFVNDLAALRWQ
jgi:peptide/nickel transport system substrate-binding protein